MKKKKKPGASADHEPAGVYTMTDLEQVKVLADPLRVRILEALCDEALTTKQVAQRLDEKPTRLYHHVDALERVGLIRLTGTRQNRGTVEKYYRAVAKLFRSDPDLFRAARASGDTKSVADVVTSMMDLTVSELRRLAESGHDAASPDEGLVSFIEIGAGQRQIAELRRKLHALVLEIGELSCDEASRESKKDERHFRLTLAFYPLDLDRRGK